MRSPASIACNSGEVLSLPEDVVEEFELDPAPIWPDDDDRLEPIVLTGPLWVDFDDEPYPEVLEYEFEDALPTEGPEVAKLDGERLEYVDEPAREPSPQASRVSIAGSIGVHLLAALFFFSWVSATAELTGAIPIQLVMEEPPVAPDQKAMGDSAPEATTEAPKTEPPAAQQATPPKAPIPPPPAPPRPLPPPPKTIAAAPPKPVKLKPVDPVPVPQQQAAVQPPPAPPPPPQQPAVQPPPVPPPPLTPRPQATAQPPQPQPATSQQPRDARPPGAGMGKGDYYSYLVTLTKAHFDILPLSSLAGRRGRTTLSVVVLEDGTIGRVSIKQSSGYPDIDAKIAQMVAAVGRFPPLPEGFQRPSTELDFNLTFPDALQQ